jgi:hypothetical protein
VARLDRIVLLLTSALVAVLGLLPVTLHWGLSLPWYSAISAPWISGSAIVLGSGLVLAIASRRIPLLWRDGRLDRLTKLVGRPAAALLLGVVALAVYAWISRAVFDARPLLIDEIIQVFQARILAAGHLWVPVPRYPEFFSSLHLVQHDGRTFGQFPVGGPAMLALGTLAGAEWLVGPVFGALGVVMFGALVRRIEPRPLVAFGALALFAFAPFAAFMSGSYMNHVTTLCWLVIGMWGLSRAVAKGGGRFRDGLWAGLGFGIAAAIRPVDGLAFAAPAGVWLLARAVRGRRVAPLVGAGLGVLAPVVLLLWDNVQTTGAPLLFGYTVVWGHAHDLGFHATPWGPVHTPGRGLLLLNLYFLRLQSFLFETPIPSLLPATLALALTRRLEPFDRYLLAAGALLAGLYFAYWHDGYYLGPRFMYPLLPLLALWTARLFGAIRSSVGEGLALRTAVYGGIVAVPLAVVTGLPARADQYRAGMLTMRWDADAAAERAGIHHALVLVRESWGAQTVARMWAVGVTLPEAEHLYRTTDACAMEHGLRRVEALGLHGPAALAMLRPLMRDSSQLVKSHLTTDPTNLTLPGSTYTADCVARLRDDQNGFTLFPPLLLARRHDVVYARDLHGRDSLLVREYPGRSLYLLRPASAAVGAAPQFYALRQDSLLRAWRNGE